MVHPAKMIAHYHVSLKEQHGICVLPLHPDDLVSHGLYILEALLVDQAVDQDEALAVLDVEIPHGRELLPSPPCPGSPSTDGDESTSISLR